MKKQSLLSGENTLQGLEKPILAAETNVITTQ